MSQVDTIVVIFWLAIVFAVGIIAGLKEDLEGFWINKRKTSTWPLILTIVATQVGAGTMVGIASSTFSSGTGFGLVAIASTVSGFIAVGYIAPWLKRFGDRHKAITLPEILLVRYGRRTQLAASLVVLFTYLSLLAGQYIALSALLGIWTGWDIEVALLFAVGGLIFYTAFAGLRGDIATDRLHFWMMVIVLFCVLLPAIISNIPLAASLQKVPAQIWSPVTFGGYAYVVVGILLGAIIPLVSMELWMRVYASTSSSQARRVFFGSALLVIPFYLLGIFLGLIAYTIYPTMDNSDFVLFKLMIDYLPNGVLGLGIGAILAVVLSSANTMILVIGATIFRDLFRRDTSSGSMVFSRLVTAGAGIVGALYAAAVPDIVQLILNAFFVIAVISPALLGIVIWKNATERAATWSIVLGALTTIIFLFIIPRQAFLPGLGISILAFVLISVFTKHSKTESLEKENLFGP